jgi:hypothetical protein
MKPPPVICNARVLEYAVTDEAMFTGKLQLYVNGVVLGAVPGLAIGESFNCDELLLFHCDEDWSVLGIQAWKKSEAPDLSVEQVKSRAEKYYANISSHWMAHDACVEDALAYREYLVGDHRCSFCSRAMYEVDSLVEGDGGARICNLCVTRFHEEVDQTRGLTSAWSDSP